METEPEPEMSEYDESDQDYSSDGATSVEIQDEATLVEIQDKSMESDVASNVEVTTRTRPASSGHWNEKEYQSIWSMESILLIFPPLRV